MPRSCSITRFISFLLLLLSGDIEHAYSLRLADRITNAVSLKFPVASSVSRVVECFRAFNAGEEIDVMLGDQQSDHNRQKSNCFVKGLTTTTFHDVNNGKFEWAAKLESNAHIVQEELKQFLLRDNAAKQEDSKWLGPRFVQENEGHYGKEWKTLGLQDRGVWDGENVDFFPKTVELLSTCQIPSCEAFFARQGPKSGIQPHSDLNNFILTSHLAVDVPEGQCWIRVGDDKHYWKNGKVCVFDTSIYHSTFNEADTDRFVLLIRFWHPDLTETEIKAFTFIFDYLDHSNLGEAALNAFEMEHLYGAETTSSSKSSSKDGNVVANAFLSNNDDKQPMSRQQRREQERKAAKMESKKTKAGGFHRGG